MINKTPKARRFKRNANNLCYEQASAWLWIDRDHAGNVRIVSQGAVVLTPDQAKQIVEFLEEDE